MKINNISTHYNILKSPEKNSNRHVSPSFKSSAPSSFTQGLANAYEGLASAKPFQSFIKKFSRSSNTFTHLLVAESCFLSGFYMLNTLRNKKIDKDQKPQMIINDTLTLGVSTAGAYLAEDKITDVVMRASEKYFVKHKDFYKQLGKETANNSKNVLKEKVAKAAVSSGESFKQSIDDVVSCVGSQLKNLVGEEGKLKAFQITKDKLTTLQENVKEGIKNNLGDAKKAENAVMDVVDDFYEAAAARKEADKILPGINKLKVLVIFGIIYRYLSPVVFTPIANKISSKLFDKKDKNKA